MLQDAEKLFEKAFHAPLEAREAIVEELWNLKLVGNKDRFENELSLDVLNKVKNARALNTSFLQLLQGLQKQYQNDPVFMNYINLEMEKFKKDVVEKILTDSTFLSSLDPKFLRELKTQWPQDESVSQAFDKLKQALPKKPRDWSIERLRKLARLYPAGCKRELDQYRNEPFVILEYDDEIKEIDQQIEKMSIEKKYHLNAAFSLDAVDIYKEKIQGLFRLQLYRLDGTVDEYVELYKELKPPRG